MVNLTKRGSTLIVKSDQSFPFEAGEITLPMNSLYFIIDESDAVVFRSVANSDIIFNALLKDLQIDGTQATKDNLVQLFDSVGNAPMGGGGSSITIDSALSETSENPVQNKVITVELNKKVESIELTQEEYDQLPTKDPNVMYVITDAPEVALKSDLANLATQSWVTEQINAAIAQVNEKITEINNKII